MKKKNAIVSLFFFASLFSCTLITADPYDQLENMKTNPYVKDAIPETIAFGEILKSTPGNEVVVGTSRKTIVIMDYNMNIINSINLESNAKKIIIDLIDEDPEDEAGIFVLTRNETIHYFDSYATGVASLSFQANIPDFIVMDTDKDSQKEIVLINGSRIEAYDLSGENIWSVKGDSNFRSLAYLREFGASGCIVASTSDKIYIFSYSGGYIFEEHIGDIREFVIWKGIVYILASRNRILKLNVQNGNVEDAYSDNVSHSKFDYVSSIHAIEEGIVVIGQRGSFQILSTNGKIEWIDNLESEITSFNYTNLDGIYFPEDIYSVKSSELVFSTQNGMIFVYSWTYDKNARNLTLKRQETYEIDQKIRYFGIFPLEEDSFPRKAFAVDAEGKIYSFLIFFHYCDVFKNYSKGMWEYSREEYRECKRTLQYIVDPESKNVATIRNRKILEYYGLLEEAEMYFEKSPEELRPIEEEGKSQAQIGYEYFTSEPSNYEKAVEHLFLAYQKFLEADTQWDEIIYSKKTLNNLISDMRECILHVLKKADTSYQRLEYEQALCLFLIIYPKMEKEMVYPSTYVEQMGLTEFKDSTKEYEYVGDVKVSMEDCIYELDKMSENAFEKGDLDESERLNNLIIEASQILETDYEEYKSRNEEIAGLRREKDERYFMIILILLLLILIINACRRKDFLLFALISILVIFSYMAVSNFGELGPNDQLKNLQLLSSALIQAYVTILALVPTVSLALFHFFAPRYPSRFFGEIWKSIEMMSFFFIVVVVSVFNYLILASLPGGNFVFFLMMELFLFSLVVLALYTLISRIYTRIDIAKILDDFEEHIQNQEMTDGRFKDFSSIMYSLVENRDLECLQKAINDLFSLIIIDHSYYHRAHRILSDIQSKFTEKNECFYSDEVARMVDNGYARIAESDNIVLIDESLDEIIRREEALRAL